MDKVQEFDSIIAQSGFTKNGFSDFDKTWDYQRFRQVLFYYVFKIQERGNKPQTVLKKINALKRFFIFLKDRDIVSINPIDDFREANLSFYKIVSEERQAVSLEKLEEIISVGSMEVKHWKNPEFDPFKTHLLRTCYLVLAKDLLRSKEFCALNIGNFYLNEKYFTTGDFAKISGKRRPLDDQTIWHIRVYWWIRSYIFGEVLTPKSPAFLGMRYKTRMNPKVLCNKVKKSAAVAGVHEEGGPLIRRFTTHNFRHSGTTLLADTEIKDSFIVYFRGDSPDRSMDRYHHPTTEKLIMEYLKHMPEFKIGESLADVYYMKEIEESMKRDEINNPA
ncbi:MAG: hypothetical protein LBU81_03160 [Methanosarcinales archaeon]|jgi:integrase|nr:hypothetical protein [Methanosarcinales archaeon]